MNGISTKQQTQIIKNQNIMKRFLLTLAVLAITATSFAQQTYQPVPFAQQKTFWCERYDSVGVVNGSLGYIYLRYVYFTNGEDTVLNGFRWRKLFISPNGDTSNAIYQGAIYEDSLRRVWYYGPKPHHYDAPFTTTSSNYFLLLYDFSLKVGDSYYPEENYINNFELLQVTSIDTIEMGGVLRKRIHFSGLEFDWIEGVGSTLGLLYYDGLRPNCEFCPWNKLLCCIQNDSLIYHWGNGNCFPTNSIEVPENILHITAYPNPTKGRITLEFGEARFSKLLLVNTAGATVLETTLTGHEPQHTLQLKGLPAGIYSCILSGKDGTATEKIIVE